MPQMFYGLPGLKAVLDALKAEDGPLDTLKIHLFKNDLNVTPETLVADMEEADYTGYAASAAIVWGAAFVNPDSSGELRAATVQFQPSGTTVGNVIYGYWLMPTVATLYPTVVVRLDDPVPLAGPLDALFVTPSYVLRQP